MAPLKCFTYSFDIFLGHGTTWRPVVARHFLFRGSSVGIATGYGLDDRGSEGSIPGGGWEFFFSTSSRPALGPTQPIQWRSGALSLGVKRPGREAGHLPPSSVEVKNALRDTSTPNTSSWSGAWLNAGTTSDTCPKASLICKSVLFGSGTSD
jgi:hypothetical protein